jgi:malonate transporter
MGCTLAASLIAAMSLSSLVTTSLGAALMNYLGLMG